MALALSSHPSPCIHTAQTAHFSVPYTRVPISPGTHKDVGGHCHSTPKCGGLSRAIKEVQPNSPLTIPYQRISARKRLPWALKIPFFFSCTSAGLNGHFSSHLKSEGVWFHHRHISLDAFSCKHGPDFPGLLRNGLFQRERDIDPVSLEIQHLIPT